MEKKKHFSNSIEKKNIYFKENENENSLCISKDFNIWHADFIRHYEIFKKVINKYAPDKRANYINNLVNVNGYQYFVKEIVFDFNIENSIDADWGIYVPWQYRKNFTKMLRKILELPNLNLNIALIRFEMGNIYATTLYQGRYLSKLNFVSDYYYPESNEKNNAWTWSDYTALRLLAAIPKPKLHGDIKDKDNKYKNLPADIAIKVGHQSTDEFHTPWDLNGASYEQFYETFLHKNYKDIWLQVLTKEHMCNIHPDKFHSPIVEIVRYENQAIKKTYTHYKFRAEVGNEDIRIFKWRGKIPE